MELIKDYTVHYKVANTDYGILVIPKGTRITNKKACGIDKNYNFVDSFDWYEPKLTGFARTMALHDFKHYGINVPKEYVG